MPPARPLRLAPEWDPRYTHMLAVSAAGHVLAVAAVLLLAPYARYRPLPLAAYTVEITDANALGGRVPPGPVTGNLGGPAAHPLPAPKGQPDAEESKPPDTPADTKPPDTKPPEPPPEPVAKTEPPPVAVPEPKPPPEPKPAPEAKPAPEPKPAPKPEAKPAPKPQAKAEAKPAPAATPPTPAHPAAKPGTSATGGKSGNPAGQENAPAHDAYAAAAERWRTRAAGGLGGTDGGSGPIGAGGEGKGGGGQLVALEFVAYRQQVINIIKGQWTNVIARPGLVARVRFQIARDGGIEDVRLEQTSGNPAYDNSALRAVQHATLPAPPARYADEFRDFMMEFHSEETGGQGAG